jgi:hypothetical protein
VAGYEITEDAAARVIQRVAQNDSAGNEIEAVTVGQTTAAASVPVVLATDDYVAAATKVDDAAFTPGTSRVLVIGAEADEGSPDSVDEGDAGALRMTLARGMHVNKRNASGTEDAYNAGAVGVTVPRVTLASDDPGVASLALIAASASVLDDWDESDRAKVNPIVGQAGVAGGAGAVGATVQRVTFCSDSPGVANATAGEYETVAASQTTQTLGATGATGDYLEAVLIVPASTAPGAVAIKDGSNGAITIFAGGTGSITDLAPIYVPLGLISTSGAWQVTTGINESAIGIGNFT